MCPSGRLPFPVQQRLPRRIQRKRQRFPRDARDEGTDQPAEAERDAARERHRFALHVNASVSLDEAPVRVESPQIAPVVAHRLLALIGSARVLDLLYAGADDLRGSLSGRNPREPRVVVAVDDDGEAFFLIEAQEHREVVAVFRKDARALHHRGEILRMVVVVLQQAHRIGARFAGNEGGADPVMDQTVRDVNLPSAIPRPQPFDEESARAKVSERLALLIGRKAVDPERRHCSGCAHFRRSDVAVE